MPRPLDGLVALVTGSSRGLGAAMARRLAREGAHAIILYHAREADARAVAGDITAAGGTASLLQADLASPAAIADLFARIAGAFPTLDILVNNAGINRDGPFVDMPLENFDAVLNTNLRGPFLCAQHAARIMLARPANARPGSIINLGASTAVRGRKNGANYCAAKAGLMTLTRCLALELAPRIRVNTLVPGLVPTEDTVERYHLHDAAAAAKYAAETPMGRLGTPEDLAAAAAFLCSPDAEFITGQTLYINGGHFMSV